MHQPRDDIEHLHLKSKKWLNPTWIDLQNGLKKYLDTTRDWMLQLLNATEKTEELIIAAKDQCLPSRSYQASKKKKKTD